MNVQDVDGSILIPAILCLTSSELCHLHCASKSLQGLVEAPGISGLFSQWHSLLAEVNKEVLGFVGHDRIYLHALLSNRTIARVAQKLREMRNPIRNLLQFRCSAEAACFAQTMNKVDPSKDFVITWTFNPTLAADCDAPKSLRCDGDDGHSTPKAHECAGDDGHNCLQLSLPIHFSCGFLPFSAELLQFSTQLCATRRSCGSICFHWRVCFSSCMLMEAADMVSVQINGSITTPFGSVSIPAATVGLQLSSADQEKYVELPIRAPTTVTESANPLLAEAWLHNRVLTKAPLTSVVSVNCLVMGTPVCVLQSCD